VHRAQLLRSPRARPVPRQGLESCQSAPSDGCVRALAPLASRGLGGGSWRPHTSAQQAALLCCLSEQLGADFASWHVFAKGTPGPAPTAHAHALGESAMEDYFGSCHCVSVALAKICEPSVAAPREPATSQPGSPALVISRLNAASCVKPCGEVCIELARGAGALRAQPQCPSCATQLAAAKCVRVSRIPSTAQQRKPVWQRPGGLALRCWSRGCL